MVKEGAFSQNFSHLTSGIFKKVFVDDCGVKWVEVVANGAQWSVIPNVNFPSMQSELNSAVVYAGTFDRSLDAKNRVTIPACWLAGKEEEEFQIIPNPSAGEPFLIVMPPAEFAQMESRILSLDAPAVEKRKFIRQFYGAARAVAADKQGRILLPEDHCKKLNLQGGVVLVGGKSRFEIWNRELWSHAFATDQPTYEKMAALIGL